jgi:hypothetical protein
MDEDVKAKLTATWQAAVARLIETGYDPADVYATMISVGLSGAEDRANDDPRPSGEVRPRIVVGWAGRMGVVYSSRAWRPPLSKVAVSSDGAPLEAPRGTLHDRWPASPEGSSSTAAGCASEGAAGAGIAPAIRTSSILGMIRSRIRLLARSGASRTGKPSDRPRRFARRSRSMPTRWTPS